MNIDLSVRLFVWFNNKAAVRPWTGSVSCPQTTVPPLHRSPLDEETVHDSFNRLIAEQTQHGGGESEAYELQQLQRDLDDESRGSDATLLFSCSRLLHD